MSVMMASYWLVMIVFEGVWLGEVGLEKHHSASVSSHALLFISWLAAQSNIQNRVTNKTQQSVNQKKKERVAFSSGL